MRNMSIQIFKNHDNRLLTEKSVGQSCPGLGRCQLAGRAGQFKELPQRRRFLVFDQFSPVKLFDGSFSVDAVGRRELGLSRLRWRVAIHHGLLAEYADDGIAAQLDLHRIQNAMEGALLSFQTAQRQQCPA